MTGLYQATILGLLVVGLALSVRFLVAHRPRNWRRLAAWDASGWVVICAVWFLRSLILAWMRWPIRPPEGWVDGLTSVGLLGLVDVLLLVRVASYRSFREQRSAAAGHQETVHRPG